MTIIPDIVIFDDLYASSVENMVMWQLNVDNKNHISILLDLHPRQGQQQLGEFRP